MASDGAILGRASVAYRSTYGAEGTAEQDPHDYARAVAQAISDCGAPEQDVGGVGLVGQTPSLVLVDAAGRPVRPAITWQDVRAGAEAAELEAEFGSAETLFGMPLPWSPTLPPARLLWLSRNEPAVVARTRWLLQPKDFVGMQLTGEPCSDPWSTKGLCNVVDGRPVAEILQRTGWTTEVVPPVAPAWTCRGTVSPGAARTFRLRPGLPVSVGWSDALAGMLAVGAFDAPSAFVLSGTSSIVGISGAAPGTTTRLLAVPRYCAPLPVLYGPTQSSGAAVDWLSGLLRRSIADLLAEVAASAPSEVAADPTFVPYLNGERAPVWRSDVRGAMLGLSATHGTAALTRAVLDGVALSERHILSVAEAEAGQRATEIRIAARDAAGAAWRAARLSAFARPLLFLAEEHASALGAAMLGAAAADGDLARSRDLSQRFQRAEPDPETAAASEQAFVRYLSAATASVEWSSPDAGAPPVQGST